MPLKAPPSGVFLKKKFGAYILAWECTIRFCLTENGYMLLVPHECGPPSVGSIMVSGIKRQLNMHMKIRF